LGCGVEGPLPGLGPVVGFVGIVAIGHFENIFRLCRWFVKKGFNL